MSTISSPEPEYVKTLTLFMENIKQDHEKDVLHLKKMILEQEMRIVQLETKTRQIDDTLMPVKAEVEKLNNKINYVEETLQEMKDNIVDSDFISFTSEMVAKKIDSFQPQLNSIFTGQIEFLKRIQQNKKLYEETIAAVAELKNMYYTVMAGENMTYGNDLEIKLDRFLIGELAWAKNRIFIENGKIVTDEGKTVSFGRFQEYMINTPWTLFPEKYETIQWATKDFESKFSVNNGKISTEDGQEMTVQEFVSNVKRKPYKLFPEMYEVECWNCKKQMDVSSNLRPDKLCVQCPQCRTGKNSVSVTALGAPKTGFEWIYCLPCEHFQEVQIGDRPKNCGFCGKKATGYGGPLSYRTPTRKQ